MFLVFKYYNSQEVSVILNQFIVIAYLDNVEVIDDSRKNKQAILHLNLIPKDGTPEGNDYLDVSAKGEMVDTIKDLAKGCVVGIKGYLLRKTKEDSIQLVAERVSYLNSGKTSASKQ